MGETTAFGYSGENNHKDLTKEALRKRKFFVFHGGVL